MKAWWKTNFFIDCNVVEVGGWVGGPAVCLAHFPVWQSEGGRSLDVGRGTWDVERRVDTGWCFLLLLGGQLQLGGFVGVLVAGVGITPSGR